MKLKTLNNRKKITDFLFWKKIFYVFIWILSIGILSFTVAFGAGSYAGKLNEGDISTRSVYSPFNFTTRGSVNEEATKKLKDKAEENVKNVYVFDNSAEENGLKAINVFFDKLKSFSDEDLSAFTPVSELFSKQFGFNLSVEEISSLTGYKNFNQLKDIAEESAKKLFSKGIVSELTFDQLNNSAVKDILLIKNNQSLLTTVSSFVKISDVSQAYRKILNEYSFKNTNIENFLIKLITGITNENIQFSEEITNHKKEEARESVALVYNMISVKKNELVADRGERINKNQIQILQSINKIQQESNRFWYGFGMAGILLLFSGIFLLFVFLKEKKLFNAHNFAVIFILFFLLIIIAKSIILSPLSSCLIPVASISMLAAILFNFNIAFMITVILSFLSGLVIGDGLSMPVMFFIGSMTAVFMLKNVNRRIKILQAGLCLVIVNSASIVFFGWFQNLDFNTILTQTFWSAGNGIFSAMLVMALLPVFENLFNITTNISLLEHSDLNHPLLKQMIMKAPGTYHHSLIVGNLSEAACEAIGANSLLARVGSYFHDIGKIEKAEYFAENQSESGSKHDKLTPDMSKLIIIKHVKEGIDLAKKYKLKNSIIDFIAQHHGTGLVFYFFKRALDEKVDSYEIDEEHYRYPGPKPQTKETAVVLLADSVEAASRALSNPTPSRIKGLVRKVINNKFIDGQLDECDLTLRELNKIAEVFIRILTGVFHSRIEYPDEDSPEKK